MGTVLGCGANNSEPGTDTKQSCPGLLPAQLTVSLVSALNSDTNHFRIELDSGEVFDKCTGQKDFSVSRSFRNLTLMINYDDVNNLPNNISINVIDLGDCSTPADDIITMSLLNHPVIWQAEHIVDKACQIDQYIYRSSF